MNSELKFLLRDKANLLWLGLAFLLSSSAIILGLREVQLQEAEITELIALDQAEQELILSEQSDWGGLAYYTFHLTYDRPSAFSFAAMGQRDLLPWKHRLRMLALEGQIHESDTRNPDFALVGRLDYAFLLSVIAPLLVVLMLHDLRSSEKTAGRLEWLEASAISSQGLWRKRATLRIALLVTAILIPLWLGGLIAGTSLFILVKTTLLTVIYLGFWAVVSLWLCRPSASNTKNLAVMTGIWILCCGFIPMILAESINRLHDLPKGSEILLTQRETVNDAWDLPKEDTFRPFLQRYPEYTGHTTVERGFAWKWYYAFQQVGDQAAEQLSQSYTQGRLAKEATADGWSWVSPATLVQRALHQWAETDTRAMIQYEEDVRSFHKNLREYYYPKLFFQQEFDASEVSNRPRYRN